MIERHDLRHEVTLSPGLKVEAIYDYSPASKKEGIPGAVSVGFIAIKTAMGESIIESDLLSGRLVESWEDEILAYIERNLEP